MKTQMEYNRCSICRCGDWSVTISALDDEGMPAHGFRLLGTSKMSRTVRVLTPDEPLYRQAYEALLAEPRAAEYLPDTIPPTPAQVKGAFDGLCNRKACQRPGARWFNEVTQAHYCEDCATQINHYSRIDCGRNICTEGVEG